MSLFLRYFDSLSPKLAFQPNDDGLAVIVHTCVSVFVSDIFKSF